MPEIINSLWIGDSLGLIEKLAITSFLRHGHPFHLYCYGTVAGVPHGTVIMDGNEVLPASSIFCYERGEGKGSPSAFSNLFRYKLMLEKGGWWVDTDAICLKSFDFAKEIVLAGAYKEDGRRVSAGVMKLPAGHAVARECYERARRRNPRKLQWGEIGPFLFTEVVTKHGLAQFVKDPSVFLPIPWWEWKSAVFEDSAACRRSYLSEATYSVHLYHEMWRRAGIDRQTRYPRGTLFSELLETYGLLEDAG